jgi:glycosyltransferase involved in cell wall biosynthesis
LKLIFLVISDGENESGVYKKIKSQVKWFNEYGVHADFVLIEAGKKNNSADTFISRFINARKNAKILRDTIRSLGTLDVLYIRYPIQTAFYPIHFFSPFRKCRVIFEYNTLVNQEMFLTHFYLDLLLEYIFGPFIRFNADAGVGVTDEITDCQRKKIGDRNKPFITIANGIEVNSVPVRTPPFFNDTDVTMICVANVSPWHGLDRLIRGIAHYSGKHSVTLHIVGEGMEISHLKTVCRHHNLGDKVIFHGFLSGPELDTLFNQSHVAIGSLGIHRKGLTQTSELKAREYCVRGIPYIIACSDPDFPKDFPYILQLPADEKPIDMTDVIRFASALARDRDHPQKMRQYASEHLEWSVKIRKLKKFLENLIPEDKGSS